MFAGKSSTTEMRHLGCSLGYPALATVMALAALVSHVFGAADCRGASMSQSTGGALDQGMQLRPNIPYDLISMLREERGNSRIGKIQRLAEIEHAAVSSIVRFHGSDLSEAFSL